MTNQVAFLIIFNMVYCPSFGLVGGVLNISKVVMCSLKPIRPKGIKTNAQPVKLSFSCPKKGGQLLHPAKKPFRNSPIQSERTFTSMFCLPKKRVMQYCAQKITICSTIRYTKSMTTVCVYVF